jgi:hypothetical protein
VRCPKCGYVSFDYNLQCPKCRSDISLEQSKMNLPSFKPSPPFLLGALVGNEDYPADSYLGGSASAGRHGSARSIGDVAESIDADRDIIFEEAFDSEAIQDIQAPSDFSGPPSHFRRQIKEIKDLISELMPEKSKAEPDEKMVDIVAEDDFSISTGDKEFITRTQTPEGDLVEGLEELNPDGVNLEGFAGWGEIQKRKRQLEDSERVTSEVDRKELKAEEE